MTKEEFSEALDILYNNISSNSSPGLNDYEKSVILTLAQEELLKNYFNPKGNKYIEGFDDSLKRQVDFSTLIKVSNPTQITNNNIIKYDERSFLYSAPSDLFFYISEKAKIKEENNYIYNINIIPITYIEYDNFNSKPYRQPFKRQGWRLIQNQLINNNNTNIHEIIVKEGAEILSYSIRYIKRPNPIIITNLDSNNPYGDFSGLTINGQSNASECELSSTLHNEILSRAVEIAKNHYTGDLSSIVQLNRSE